MPSLAFFTTYALLVLFWAEIYYQVRDVNVLSAFGLFWNNEAYLHKRYSDNNTLVLNVKQARAASTDGLRPSFITINAVVYAVQVKFLSHCPFSKSWQMGEVLKLDSLCGEASSIS